jgi:dipeptide/tripeptide permease
MFFCAVLSGPTWPNSEIFIYISFLFLEIAVGLYFPAIGYVRGEVIPDGLRANIMNWFRVPMNIITCGGLIGMHKLSNSHANQIMFLLCAALSILGLVISLVFSRMMKRTPAESTKEDLLT